MHLFRIGQTKPLEIDSLVIDKALKVRKLLGKGSFGEIYLVANETGQEVSLFSFFFVYFIFLVRDQG